MKSKNKVFSIAFILFSVGTLIYLLEGFIFHNTSYLRLTNIDQLLLYSEWGKSNYVFCFNDGIFSGIEQTIACITILLGVQAIYDGVKL